MYSFVMCSMKQHSLVKGPSILFLKKKCFSFSFFSFNSCLQPNSAISSFSVILYLLPRPHPRPRKAKNQQQSLKFPFFFESIQNELLFYGTQTEHTMVRGTSAQSKAQKRLFWEGRI